jgi:phthalate 4,5-dioxygenase
VLSRADNELLTRTGQGTPMGELFRRFWLPVLLTSEVPEPDRPPVRVRVMGEDLVAFRDSRGRVGLLAEHCAHRGASLFFGRNEESGLRCVYHGWKYDVDGRCVDMPSEPPQSTFQARVRQQAYPCREAAGMVWAYLGPADHLADFPQLPFTLVPDDHVYTTKMIVECNYLQVLEGDIDNSHASILHARLSDDTESGFRQRLRDATRLSTDPGTPLSANLPWYYANDTAPKGMVCDTDYGIMMGWRRNGGHRYQWRINHWLMPAFALIANGEEGSTIGCNVEVPIDDTRCWMFRLRCNWERPLTDAEITSYREGGLIYPRLIPGTFIPAENKSNDYRIDRDAQRAVSVSGITSVPQQDRAVNESMGDIFDRSAEHLGSSDVVITAVRRRMLAMATRLQRDSVVPYPASHGEVYRRLPVDLLLDRDIDWSQIERQQLAIDIVASPCQLSRQGHRLNDGSAPLEAGLSN